MNKELNTAKNYTIKDMARELGVSESTISRALSGKGRIGRETAEKIQKFAEEKGYRPNVLAKGLIQNCTFNLGLIIPLDSTDIPFFKACMDGICEEAAVYNYDIILSIAKDGSFEHIRRLILNKKVDGFILTRAVVNSGTVKLLKKYEIPFIVIGPPDDMDIISIDNPNQEASRELTELLLMKGLRRLMLFGGNPLHYVSESRRQGFLETFRSKDLLPDESSIFMGIEDYRSAKRAVEHALTAGADGIICMDDTICSLTLGCLREMGVDVPGRLKLASLYDSPQMEHNVPPVTSLRFDTKELGKNACRRMLEILGVTLKEERTPLHYQVILRESTK